MSSVKEYAAFDGVGLAALIRKREVSAKEVIESAIEKIQSIDPKINAVCHRLFDSAVRLCDLGVHDGPFAGVPFLLKDLVLQCKGVPVTNGSKLFEGFVARHDGELTKRYRAAGMIFVGRSNIPEFGLSCTTEPSLYGPTRNPWDLTRSPGGSSGGAAAAVAAGMVPLAHATDGAGSIRIPASNCGLFGLKPTRARTPAGPDVGEGWNGLSSFHCVSRSVRDSAALLDATHGPAIGDPYYAPPPTRRFAEEVQTSPGRLKIALSVKTVLGTPVDPDCIEAVQSAAKLCEDLGHTIIEADPDFSGEQMVDAVGIIASCNTKLLIERRMAALKLTGAPPVEMISQLTAERANNVSSLAFLGALQSMHAIGRDFASFFEDFDVLLTPTLGQPPLPLGSINMMDSDYDRYWRQFWTNAPFTGQFNVSGLPGMTVPLFWSAAGLPIGTHFGARAGGELVLFRLAAQLEQAKPWVQRFPVPVK